MASGHVIEVAAQDIEPGDTLFDTLVVEEVICFRHGEVHVYFEEHGKAVFRSDVRVQVGRNNQ